jgi:phosphoglucosamine mutase
MNKQFFGTDGIRGAVGQYPITADFMLKLGWAAGKVFGETDSVTHVLIGKDTRVSGYMFESALEAGLVAAGARVTLAGADADAGGGDANAQPKSLSRYCNQCVTQYF